MSVAAFGCRGRADSLGGRAGRGITHPGVTSPAVLRMLPDAAEATRRGQPGPGGLAALGRRPRPAQSPQEGWGQPAVAGGAWDLSNQELGRSRAAGGQPAVSSRGEP